MERNKASHANRDTEAITDDQVCQTEKAIINQSEWHFAQEYLNLMVFKERWFSHMSSNAKKLHIKKVFSQRPYSQNHL